jgi:hypothetical protein
VYALLRILCDFNTCIVVVRSLGEFSLQIELDQFIVCKDSKFL